MHLTLANQRERVVRTQLISFIVTFFQKKKRKKPIQKTNEMV